MKRTNQITLTLTGLFFASALCFAQQGTPELNAKIEQLAQEVKTMKMEMTQQAIENQQWKIKKLTKEQEQVKAERQQVERQQQLRDQLVQSRETDNGEEQPGSSAQLAPGITTKSQALAQREEEVAAELQQEQQKLMDLLKRLRRLRGTS